MPTRDDGPMTNHADRAARLLALHTADTPLLLPNPWDAGTAKLLASLGFEALATTSLGTIDTGYWGRGAALKIPSRVRAAKRAHLPVVLMPVCGTSVAGRKATKVGRR